MQWGRGIRCEHSIHIGSVLCEVALVLGGSHANVRGTYNPAVITAIYQGANTTDDTRAKQAFPHKSPDAGL